MRSTHAFEVLKKITPAIGKRIDAWTTADGMVGLFHDDEDGNAYEVEVRPASLSKHGEFDKFTKKRTMKESRMPNLRKQFMIEVERFLRDNFDFEDLKGEMEDSESGFCEFVVDNILMDMEESGRVDDWEMEIGEQLDLEEAVCKLVRSLIRKKMLPTGRGPIRRGR